MKHFYIFCVLLAVTISTSFADEHPGSVVFKNCLACHGPMGVTMETPLLHGQSKDYIAKELKLLRSDERPDLIMGGTMNNMAKTLSDNDIINVADFLSLQSPCDLDIAINPLDGDVEAGQAKASICLGCHYVGNALTAPVLIGQKTIYIVRSLQAFRSKKRASAYMNNVAANFTDQDISDLAAYWNSQRSCQ